MPRKKGTPAVGERSEAETFEVIIGGLRGTIDGLTASLRSLKKALEAVEAHMDANPELGDTPVS